MTSAARPHISDEQRRARLVRRHFVDGADPVQISHNVNGFHSTTASTVHLSAWARNRELRPSDIETALYDERTLVKQLCMRRTLFVLTRPLLAAAVGAVGPRVGASERTNMLRDLRKTGHLDPDGWIDGASAAVLDLLSTRTLAAADVRTALPEWDLGLVFDGDPKTYPMLPRVLNRLAALGEVVRGPNRADWRRSKPEWTAMSSWLGEDLQPLSVDDGHRALIENWLRTYGPGTETDLVWWLGSTKTAVRKALAELDVVEVDLDGGGIGYLMHDDVADVEPPPPSAALLPELDPATMGWKQREFYLGPHTAELFDRNGNGGQTAWWGGRIVGGWHQNRQTGRIHVVALEDLSAEAEKALAERADELQAWLGDDRPVIGYPSPLTQKHR